MLPSLNTEQWTKLLSLLSLDGALALYDDMGVPVADKKQFQGTLRDVIREARRQYETQPKSPPQTANMLLNRLDSHTAQRFERWARGAFLGYHADQPNWSSWDIVFSHWAHSRRKDLEFLPPKKCDSLVEGYRTEAETADVKEKAAQILNQPLSDWDLEVFSRQGYGGTWESTPYSTAEWVARIERLKRFVRKIWQTLSPNEREELHRRAQILTDELGVWMPGELPRLEDLLKAE